MVETFKVLGVAVIFVAEALVVEGLEAVVLEMATNFLFSVIFATKLIMRLVITIIHIHRIHMVIIATILHLRPMVVMDQTSPMCGLNLDIEHQIMCL